MPTSFETQAIVTHGDTHLSLTCRNLDLTTTQEAFDNGNHAYAADDYTGAIDSYTQALNILRAKIASVILLHRAAAYEMEHDYTSALRDGSQANPNDNSPEPDPYIAKGNALTFQNNLKSAALVLKKGIDNVDATHPGYPRLVKRHKQLLDEMDRRNRWMMNILPYEVISRILANLSFDDRHRLSQTCCFWRSFMLREWSPMWSTIDASEMPTPVHKTDRLLDMVPSDSVKRVKLDSITETIFIIVEGNMQRIDSSDTVSGRILKTMMEQKWNHIESLAFRYQLSANSRCYPSYQEYAEVIEVEKSCYTYQS
ncbi:hypothetical protein BJV82DRAFT_187824 [Fennellomyces sp. T-0311]|nr:hypothetical protein BJV82DRAFT_187824 [Fennellomyces sp. T-0311]